MDPMKEIHRSVRAALVAESTVTAIVPSARMFDAVPQVKDQLFPFIKVNVNDAVEDDNGCGRAWMVNVTVDVWSRAVGTIQTKEAMAAIRTALDGVSSVAGFNLNFVQFAFSRILEETDGRTTHGVVSYQIKVSEVTTP